MRISRRLQLTEKILKPSPAIVKLDTAHIFYEKYINRQKFENSQSHSLVRTDIFFLLDNTEKNQLSSVFNEFSAGCTEICVALLNCEEK